MNHVAVEIRDGHSVLLLNRPPVNAVNRALLEDLNQALDQLEDGGVPTPFIFSALGDTFCAGLDLREVPAYGAAEQKKFIQLCNRTAARLYTWPAPVVGAINGHAMAAGFVLALTPDFRIAAEGGAQFGIPEIKAGIPFPAVPLTIMNAELPSAVVRRLALTCRKSPLKEAKHDGVVDEIVSVEALQDRATEMLSAMAALPRQTYWRVKAQVRQQAWAQIESILTSKSDPLLDSWLSGETPQAAARALDA